MPEDGRRRRPEAPGEQSGDEEATWRGWSRRRRLVVATDGRRRRGRGAVAVAVSAMAEKSAIWMARLGEFPTETPPRLHDWPRQTYCLFLGKDIAQPRGQTWPYGPCHMGRPAGMDFSHRMEIKGPGRSSARRGTRGDLERQAFRPVIAWPFQVLYIFVFSLYC